MQSTAKNPKPGRIVRLPVSRPLRIVEPVAERPTAQDSVQADKVLTIEDVAEILRCSKAHVSNALNGKIPKTPRLTHFSIGRRKLVRREWLEQWMEANKNE